MLFWREQFSLCHHTEVPQTGLWECIQVSGDPSTHLPGPLKRCWWVSAAFLNEPPTWGALNLFDVPKPCGYSKSVDELTKFLVFSKRDLLPVKESLYVF